MNDRIVAEKQFEFMTSQLHLLPSLPQAVYRVLQLISNPNSSVTQISDAVATDPVLVSRVLSLANSGFYAIPGGATNLERAVTTLGMDTMSQLVFTATVTQQFQLEESHAFKLRDFWKHSLAVAIASEALAKAAGHKDAAMIYMAGLCHDLGKLVYMHFFREDWFRICEYARLEEITISEAEKLLNVASHESLGFELAKRWNLPLMIQEAILHHHSIFESKDPAEIKALEENSSADAITIIATANMLVHSFHFGYSGHNSLRNPRRSTIEKLLGEKPGETKKLILVGRALRDALSKADSLLTMVMAPPQNS